MVLRETKGNTLRSRDICVSYLYTCIPPCSSSSCLPTHACLLCRDCLSSRECLSCLHCTSGHKQQHKEEQGQADTSWWDRDDNCNSRYIIPQVSQVQLMIFFSMSYNESLSESSERLDFRCGVQFLSIFWRLHFVLVQCTVRAEACLPPALPRFKGLTWSLRFRALLTISLD